MSRGLARVVHVTCHVVCHVVCHVCSTWPITWFVTWPISWCVMWPSRTFWKLFAATVSHPNTDPARSWLTFEIERAGGKQPGLTLLDRKAIALLLYKYRCISRDLSRVCHVYPTWPVTCNTWSEVEVKWKWSGSEVEIKWKWKWSALLWPSRRQSRRQSRAVTLQCKPVTWHVARPVCVYWEQNKNCACIEGNNVNWFFVYYIAIYG